MTTRYRLRFTSRRGERTHAWSDVVDGDSVAAFLIGALAPTPEGLLTVLVSIEPV